MFQINVKNKDEITIATTTTDRKRDRETETEKGKSLKKTENKNKVVAKKSNKNYMKKYKLEIIKEERDKDTSAILHFVFLSSVNCSVGAMMASILALLLFKERANSLKSIHNRAFNFRYTSKQTICSEEAVIKRQLIIALS